MPESRTFDAPFGCSSEIRGAQAGDSGAGLRPPRELGAPLHALREPRLPVHGSAAPAARALLPVELQDSWEDPLDPALRRAGKVMPGVGAQPQEAQAPRPSDGATLPQRDQPDPWRDIASVRCGKLVYSPDKPSIVAPAKLQNLRNTLA